MKDDLIKKLEALDRKEIKRMQEAFRQQHTSSLWKIYEESQQRRRDGVPIVEGDAESRVALLSILDERSSEERKLYIFTNTQAWLIVIFTGILTSCAVAELFLKLGALNK